MSRTNYSWNHMTVRTMIVVALVVAAAILVVYFMTPESLTTGGVPVN